MMRCVLAVSLSFMLAGCAAASGARATSAGTGASGGTGGTGGAPSATSGGLGGSFEPSSGSGTGAGTCTQTTLTTYGPGADGVVGTADDVVIAIDEYQLAGTNQSLYGARALTHLALNPAMMPTLYETWTYDPKGPTKEIREWAPGPDGKYGTSDDLVASINVYALDATNLYVSDVLHTGAGPDGIWEDADDTIGSSIVFLHDKARISWALLAMMPGPDGVWGTSDDVFDQSLRIEYDASGRVANLYECNQPGADGVFGTADDVISLRISFPCRGDHVVDESFVSPGPDGQWDTADDVLGARTIETSAPCLSTTCSVIGPFG